jgi:carbonic anhydrase
MIEFLLNLELMMTQNFRGSVFSHLALILLFATGSPQASLADEKDHWSYSGDDGPGQWGDLSIENFMCVKGRNQSPIELSGALDADLPELVFDYSNPGSTGEINNGHTIQVNIKPGNFAMIGGRQYEVIQAHFHSPSEHSVNGKLYPMEIHLVHANEDRELAVIGILFDEGEENAILNRLDSFRPPDAAPNPATIDFNELITSRTEYFTYNGSLTTPPCSEGVLWTVLKNPLIASKEQIERFHDVMGSDTNRPLQPRNARVILE